MKLKDTKDFNVIVNTGFLKGDEQETFFDGDEIDIVLHADADMGDVLVAAGVFSSKNQARKAGWKDKWDIPWGWTDFTSPGFKTQSSDIELSPSKTVSVSTQRGFGKSKRKIFILKPDKSNLEDHDYITLPDGKRVDGVNPRLKRVSVK